MRLSISLAEFDVTPSFFLLSAGYMYIESRRTGQGSFVRRLGRNFYPRFHIYYTEEGDKVTFNVHLDQKQASYQGTAAHSGEYNGETVETEVGRLKKILSRLNTKAGYRPNPRLSPAAPASDDSRSQRWSNMLRRM